MMPGPGISVMWHSRVPEVLVRLGKAEYIAARRPAGQKRNVMRSMANVEPFAANPKKPEIRT